MNPYQNHTDTELVQLLSEGDELAFKTIYKRYVQGLLHFANKSIFNKEDCEEIVQDIFISLWSRRQALLRVQSLRAYLYKSARHKIVDCIRHSLVKQKYQKHYRLFEAVYEELPADITEQNIIEVIDATIAKLPGKCQMAIRMRLHEDLSYQEIALRMEISVKTVEKHISAALKHVRAACKGYGSA